MKKPRPKIQPSRNASPRPARLSASHTRKEKETMRRGVKSIGGSAPAARAPINAANAKRRQPARRVVQAAQRSRGARGPAARKTKGSAAMVTPSRGLGLGIGGHRRQAANSKPLDAPWVGIQHFELDARRVPDDLAALRNAAGE